MSNSDKTIELLTELASDKQQLVDILVSKGVSASMSESLESLNQKVEALQTEVTSETATVNPSKVVQTVRPKTADYLSEVTVNAISDAYTLVSGTAKIVQNGTYDVKQYASVNVAVESGSSSTPVYDPNLIEKTIYNNGEYNAYTDGADGFSKVIVEVGEVTTEEVTVEPTKEVIEVIPSNAEYISKVTVVPIPDTYIQPSGQEVITDNGTYNIADKEEVVVAVVNATSTSPIPTDISSPEEMTAILTTASPEDNGRVYRYVGETGKYIQNAYYKIEVHVDG